MDKTIKLESTQETQALLGPHDRNIKLIENEFKVKIALRGDHLKLSGTSANLTKASSLIEYLLGAFRQGQAAVG